LDATAVVNGPKDAEDWYGIDWDQAERDVRRLRQRIFAASQEGDLKKVRNLQRLMLRSRANALVSVRRVTEVNAGRKTPGVDGKVALLASQKADLADWCQRRSRLWTARPVRRVLIPKPGSAKKRTLGIPVIADRALQAMTVSALEPEREARFEPRSYGFRPGRGCHDAIAAIFWTVAGSRTKRRRALDADLKAAFDHADHGHILRQLGTFPRQGADRRVAEGRGDRGRQARPDRGGHPARRRDQPVDLRHRAPRDGGGRRGRLPVESLPGSGIGDPGHPGAGEVCR